MSRYIDSYFTVSCEIITVVWVLVVQQNSLVVLEVLQAQCLLWDQLDPKYTQSKGISLERNKTPTW